MKKGFYTLVLVLALLCASAIAQNESKYNFDIGGGVGFPAATLSNFANSGGNFVVGGGVNLGPLMGVNAEYMYQDLPPKQSIIALTGAPGGSARQNSLTGNVMLHLPARHKFGFYGITGIGWYHRSWDLTAPTLAIGTVCAPSFTFWGVVCTNGLVSANQVLKSGSSNAFGWNIGGGITYRLGESHFKLYAESRVHFAYYSGVNSRIVPLTFGVRW